MALCRRLSPRTVYERFFSFRPLLPEQAHAFANVDNPWGGYRKEAAEDAWARTTAFLAKYLKK